MCLEIEIYFDRKPYFGIFPSFCGMKISSQQTLREQWLLLLSQKIAQWKEEVFENLMV